MSLSTALSELALQHRLSWSEVEALLQLAKSDVEQAVRDVEFDAVWNERFLATNRVMATYESLKPRGLA